MVGHSPFLNAAGTILCAYFQLCLLLMGLSFCSTVTPIHTAPRRTMLFHLHPPSLKILGLPQLESFFFSWQSPTYSSNWCHLPLMLSLVHQPSLSTLPLGSKSIRIMPLLWQQSHFLGLIFCGCFSPLCQILKSLRAERLAHRDVPKDKWKRHRLQQALFPIVSLVWDIYSFLGQLSIHLFWNCPLFHSVMGISNILHLINAMMPNPHDVDKYLGLFISFATQATVVNCFFYFEQTQICVPGFMDPGVTPFSSSFFFSPESVLFCQISILFLKIASLSLNTFLYKCHKTYYVLSCL